MVHSANVLICLIRFCGPLTLLQKHRSDDSGLVMLHQQFYVRKWCPVIFGIRHEYVLERMVFR